MNAPMSFDDFYRQTMAANGLVIETEPVEKLAEARGVDPAIAKLAKAVFDQTRLDGIEYEHPKARLEDAFKVAEAYVSYMDEIKTSSTKLAADLMRVAAHAIEGYLAHNGVDMATSDGIKIAAICVEDTINKVAAPGSDFVMRMAAARKAKKGLSGGAPEKGETAAHEAGESPAKEKTEDKK